MTIRHCASIPAALNRPASTASATTFATTSATASDAAFLDAESLIEVFQKLVEMSPIHKAVVLRSLNWQVCRAVNYALWRLDTIDIELKWHEDRSLCPEPLIFIQKSPIASLEKAVECLQFLLSHARCIRTLTVNTEVSNVVVLNALLEQFLQARNVQLEVLKIRRRYVGQSFPVLSALIARNAETLRVLGRVGLSEAVASFSDVMHLERVSLMNFDLAENGELNSDVLAEKTRACLRRLAGLGATFDHMSYTAYSGFDIAKNPTLFMLKSCEVKSIRLTMQEGVAISETATARALLDGLVRLEVIGCVDVPRHSLSVMFPNLEYFDVQRQDLATGSSPQASRSRTVSEVNVTDAQPAFHESALYDAVAAAC